MPHDVERALLTDNARFQQNLATVLPIEVHRGLQRLEFAPAGLGLLQIAVLVARRAERLDLLAGGHHRLVGGIELAKFADQPVGDLEG